MSRRTVEAVFQALFLLSDIRSILRETAPSHSLDADQKEQVAKAIARIKKQIAIIEEEMVA